MPLYQPPDVHRPVLSQFSLKGKVALVTGGSRGIGLQVVTGLAEAGADVAFVYKQSTDTAATCERLQKLTGQKIVAYQSDVTDRKRIAETINQVAADFGHLDVVVANAGVCQNVPSLEYDEEKWAFINSVNYDGVLWTAVAAGKIFKQQGRGNLIVTASVSATLVNVPQTQAAYNASKAGVLQLARGLAVEWTEFARVNCVSPGYVLTEILTKQPAELMNTWLGQIPGRRVCDPAELKALYVFLASDACCYMTGSNLVIDGGYTIP